MTSILNTRKDIELEYHKGLATVLKKHVFVGIVDNDYSLIQYETKLFMLNHTVLAEEYFYQTVIYNFSHFYKLKIPSKPNIKDLISIGLDMNDMKVVTMTQEGNIPKHKRVETAVSKLMNHNRRAMLEDYSWINIDNQAHAEEHCLEVQLPFLQATQNNFNIRSVLHIDCRCSYKHKSN